MSSFVAIVAFVAISILSEYLQKRAKKERERRAAPPAPGQPAPPTQPAEWPQTAADLSRQLREFLQPKPVNPPPPVLVQQGPAPGAAKAPAPAAFRPKPIVPTLITEPDLEAMEVEVVNPLKEGRAAYDRAAAIDRRVEARMQAVDAMTQRARASQPAGRLAPSRAASLVSSHHRLRELVLASVILGPPKAVD